MSGRITRGGLACAACAAPLAVAGALLLSACVSSAPPRLKQTPKPDTASAVNTQLGIEYLKQGDLNLAKEKLERAEKENPRDPNVHMALAMLNDRLREPAKADAEFRAALRLSPKNPDITNNYAVFLCQSKRYDEGVKRFHESANNPLYRTPEAAWTNAGVCLREAKRLDDARLDFSRALQIRPNFAEAAYQLSDLEFTQGNKKEAGDRVDQFLNYFNATPELLLLRVRVARSMNDRLATERFARRLRSDFPESEQSRQLADVLRNPG